MTAPEILELTSGPAIVWYRLALAVRCVDGRTGSAISSALVIRRELDKPSGRSLEPLTWAGAGATLQYGPSVGSRVVLRLEVVGDRWLPRRLAMRLPDRVRAAAVDAIPPGPVLTADQRSVEAWLFPGPAYPVPAGATGARLRISRLGQPVPWPRLQLFGPGGVPAGWAHGDEHGDVLVLVTGTGTIPPPAPPTFTIAVRVHLPDPARPPGVGPPDPFAVPETAEPLRTDDPLAALVAERVTPPAGPALPEGLDPDAAHGTSVPAGYVTTAQDYPVPLTTGRMTAGSIQI
jgi:hypothetical protein